MSRIFGFIGPNRSGKNYRMNGVRNDCISKEIPFIQGDFSDGIRETFCKIFTDEDVAIDLTGKNYDMWKKSYQNIALPNGSLRSASGRKILENLAEHIKRIAGKDVWARYTQNKILNQVSSLCKSDIQNKNYIIAFGSVRFEDELRKIFELSKKLDCPVTLIFCNYFGEKPLNEKEIHVSEKLANDLNKEGFEDGSNVTDFVYNKFFGR